MSELRCPCTYGCEPRSVDNNGLGGSHIKLLTKGVQMLISIGLIAIIYLTSTVWSLLLWATRSGAVIVK